MALPIKLSLNYLLSRIGNDRYDEADTDFEASNDILAKHVTGFSYNQSLLEEKMRSEERRVGKECRSRWSPYH